MQRDQVLEILARHRDRLRSEYGVRRLTLFGSTARGEALDSSDVDLLVEFDRPTGLFGLIRLEEHLSQLLGRPVDLGTPNSLRPSIRERVLAEAIDVR